MKVSYFVFRDNQLQLFLFDQLIQSQFEKFKTTNFGESSAYLDHFISVA